MVDIKFKTAMAKKNKMFTTVNSLNKRIANLKSELATSQKRAEKAESDLSRVDEVLARRPALDDTVDRIDKILLAIKTAKSAYEMELSCDGLRFRLAEFIDASPEKSDWCPVCKQGWDCAKREQKYRVELTECWAERDELKIERDHHAGAHGITLSREYNLREALKKIRDNKHEWLCCWHAQYFAMKDIARDALNDIPKKVETKCPEKRK